MSWKLALIVAAGGALGTVGRYGLGLALAPLSQSLPWGTIAINIVGSLVIGFTAAQTRFPLSEAARLFVMVGLCGGFTTFSAFSLQTFDLLRTAAIGRAVLNVVVSVAACLVAVGLGYWLASSLGRPLNPVATR